MRIGSRIIIIGCLLILTAKVKSQNKQTLVENLRTLSSSEMEGRRSGTLGHQKAQTFIIDQFKKFDVVPFTKRYRQEFDFNLQGVKTKGINILGQIKGKTDSILVISAHYDHLGESNGKIYFGADDNASGVAAMLFIAEYFQRHQPHHTIVLAAFDAEEFGIHGSDHFASTVDTNNIVFNVNMDMISRNDEREIYASGTSHNPYLKPMLKRINQKCTEVKILFGHDEQNSSLLDWTFSSDHRAFHRKGVPYIYFGVEDHQDYHKHTDTYEKIDKEFYVNVVNMILDFVLEIDNRKKI